MRYRGTMRVTIYDRNPGPGLMNSFLKLSWFLGCFFQELFGKADAYYGASTWNEALAWLAHQEGKFTSIQFWGHGSPGRVYMAGEGVSQSTFFPLMHKVTPNTIVWFRSCSVFQGRAGQAFSGELANYLGCTIAGHTRIIGPLQGGLHTRKPNTQPSWPETEVELSGLLVKLGLKGGNNTVTCLATDVPDGW